MKRSLHRDRYTICESVPLHVSIYSGVIIPSTLSLPNLILNGAINGFMIHAKELIHI
jgi:hypothetical protein